MTSIIPTLDKQILTALNRGEFKSALRLAESNSSIVPPALALLTKGLSLLNVDGNLDEAEQALSKAHQIAKGNDSILCALGSCQFRAQKFQLAKKSFTKALKRNSSNLDAIIQVAMCDHFLGASDNALKRLTVSLEKISSPNEKFRILKAKAFIEFEINSISSSIKTYESALVIVPNDSELNYNYGTALTKSKQTAEALKAFSKAEMLGYPGKLELYENMGLAALNEGKEDLAERYLSNAVHIEGPRAAPNASYHLALCLLRRGNLKAGFDFFDARLDRTGDRLHKPIPGITYWDGITQTGSLYAWSEQGLGDQLLFSQNLGWLREFFTGPITVCIESRLIPIIEPLHPNISFCSQDVVSPGEYDFQIATGSLCRIKLRHTGTPWQASRRIVAGDRVNQNPATRGDRPFKIGISWYSKNQELNEKNIPAVLFAQIFRVLKTQQVNLVNLQYDASASELGVIEATSGLAVDRKNEDNTRDIDGLATVMSELDLVVTISNTTAHLAGALGIETLVLVPKNKGRLWYWFDIDKNSRSRIYPSVTVIEQTIDGDWTESLAKTAAVIDGF